MKPKHKRLRFNSVLEKSTSKLWGHQIRVPKRIAVEFVAKNSRRVLCSLNGGPERQCALLPVGNEAHVISVNTNLLKSLRLRTGDIVTVRLMQDESEYGLPMPEEFEELLRQDKEGHRLLHALTPGKRRTLLYIVGRGKSSEQRIERAVIIVRHLKENGGKINYRLLGEMMKKGRTER